MFLLPTISSRPDPMPFLSLLEVLTALKTVVEPGLEDRRCMHHAVGRLAVATLVFEGDRHRERVLKTLDLVIERTIDQPIHPELVGRRAALATEGRVALPPVADPVTCATCPDTGCPRRQAAA